MTRRYNLNNVQAPSTLNTGGRIIGDRVLTVLPVLRAGTVLVGITENWSDNPTDRSFCRKIAHHEQL
jgi:hypothetical protein